MAESENNNEGNKSSFESFDDFIQSVDEPIKTLYSNHISGLKNALESEKENRRKLSEQVKALTPAVEKGSELEKRLAETAKMLEEAERVSVESQRRALFAEQAIRPGVGCTNVKAAYALAVADNLFTEDGVPKWADIKKSAPELFRITNQTNAGNTEGRVSDNINAAIRRAAGL